MEINEFIDVFIKALVSGVFLFIGVYLGARLSPRWMRDEFEKWMEESETFQAMRKLIKEQSLVEKATKFFEEATVLVSSPEAKNFFTNITELMKELSGAPEVKVKLPEKRK